jgi:hypothetical protein
VSLNQPSGKPGPVQSRISAQLGAKNSCIGASGNSSLTPIVFAWGQIDVTRFSDRCAFVSVVVYLASVFVLAAYLRKHHRELWLSPGQPSLLNLSILNSLRMTKLIFWRAPKALNDPRLYAHINLVRAFAALCFLLMLIAAYHSTGAEARGP